jgi:hypothetical protein
MVAAELAFGEATAGQRTRRTIEAEQDVFRAAFEAYLGDLERVAILARAFDELAEVPDLDPAAYYLLSRIATSTDGPAVGRLLDDPQMARTNVARWLCRLLLRKMIIVA